MRLAADFMDKVTRTFEKIDRIQDMTTSSFLRVSPPDEEEEREIHPRL